MKIFKILTYNIHNGFNINNRRFVLGQIKKSIEEMQADILCLQEVIGMHTKHEKKVKDWPKLSQFEYIADKTWEHYAYGKNAVYPKGHHGNAILSKIPISSWSNHDISTPLEKRGILHTVIDLTESITHPEKKLLHIFCVHLGLFERDRKKQIQTLIDLISKNVSNSDPLIIAGDFNDWKLNATKKLSLGLELKEAFHQTHRRHAITFPANFPVLALDRIYYKNITCINVQLMKKGVWNKLSDHLPIYAEFQI